MQEGCSFSVENMYGVTIKSQNFMYYTRFHTGGDRTDIFMILVLSMIYQCFYILKMSQLYE